ncbi:hypothetical protein [Luteolibacter sp. Populi]|uniref:hypothetical protein n=1 Tax=Luteolibacter sp. Populi TaxID=3230487 RepID=UPI003465B819
MTPRSTATLLCALALLPLASCSLTGNLAKSEGDTCEIHHRKMEVRQVAFSPGYSGYMPVFNRALRKQFPHHGHTHFYEDHSYMYVPRKGQLHVCDECDRQYEKWTSQHKGPWP